MTHADPTIPLTVIKAAKRGFIRTTAQAYAATLSGGIATTAVLAIVTGTVDLLTAGVTLGVALASPPVAGLASYLSIIAKGVPTDYLAADPIVNSYSPGSTLPSNIQDSFDGADEYAADLRARDAK